MKTISRIRRISNDDTNCLLHSDYIKHCSDISIWGRGCFLLFSRTGVCTLYTLNANLPPPHTHTNTHKCYFLVIRWCNIYAICVFWKTKQILEIYKFFSTKKGNWLQLTHWKVDKSTVKSWVGGTYWNHIYMYKIIRILPKYCRYGVLTLYNQLINQSRRIQYACFTLCNNNT